MKWIRAFKLAATIWGLAILLQALAWICFQPLFVTLLEEERWFTILGVSVGSLIAGFPGIVTLAVVLKILASFSEKNVPGNLLAILLAGYALLGAVVMNFPLNEEAMVYFLWGTFFSAVVSVLLHYKKLLPPIISIQYQTNKITEMEQEIPTQQHPQEPSYWQQNKLLVKGTVIGILILLMLIPTTYIRQLVQERENRQKEVQEEVSSKWASSQTVSGPVLVVPYLQTFADTTGRKYTREMNAYFLPDNLQVNGKIDPEVKKRNLYEVVLYRSDITMTGNFKAIDAASLELQPEQLLTNKAHIIMGLTDARGMEEHVMVNWNNQRVTFSPGAENNPIVGKGLHALVTVQPGIDTGYNFTLQLKLKGSHSFFLTPSAGSIQAKIRSTWKDPAFDGDFLGEHQISDSGFNAEWKLLGQNANLPQSWKGESHKLGATRFGVNLIQPTDGYSKTMRSVKYAILFIGLTFSLFFFIEVLQKKSVHPVQYVLIGLALSIFYTLLLSFSEYLNFDLAYLIATLATVLLITLYSKSLFHKWKLAFLFGTVLFLLYFFIYVLLQAQDNALLFGSIGLFFTLAVIMYFSRKINWSGATAPSNTSL